VIAHARAAEKRASWLDLDVQEVVDQPEPQTDSITPPSRPSPPSKRTWGEHVLP
jgi:hypothetical protein